MIDDESQKWKDNRNIYLSCSTAQPNHTALDSMQRSIEAQPTVMNLNKLNMNPIIRSQPSERWAMYRLICPVIDAALQLNGLEAFFEYAQPSGPNRTIRADVAIMHGDMPIWLIEAKKFSQKLNPALVESYLKPGVMGVVTNGNSWVFLVQGKTLTYSPIVRPDGTIEAAYRTQITQLLSATSEEEALSFSDKWKDEWQPIPRHKVPPIWHLNKGTGTRKFARKETFTTASEAFSHAMTYAQENSPTGLLLTSVLRNNPSINGKFEVSSKRLIWWLPTGKRGVRINLETKQLDMLVRNSLLDSADRSDIKASMKLHDKNHDMSICRATTPTEIESLIKIFKPT